MKQVLIEAKNIYKSFPVKGGEIQVLRGVDLQVREGDFLIIHGPSGCGKSTLLHTFLGLERPTSGKVSLLGKDVYSLPDDERAELRKEQVGVLYQQPIWVRAFTVLENVAVPLNLRGLVEGEALKRAAAAMGEVGLADGWDNFIPTELSSGQQARAGLARALVSDPAVLVVDEPTGNLDSKGGLELMELLKKLVAKFGKTVVMVTHDMELLPFGSRVIKMLDGQIIKDDGNDS